MAQLMPLPLTVSCFSEIQIGFNFLVLAHPGSPGKRAVKRVLFSLILLHDVVLSLTFVWFVFCPASWSSAASWQLQVGPCQLQVGPCQLCCVVVRCARAYAWSTRETAHRHYTHQETGTALVRNKKLTHTHTHPFNGPFSGTTQVG